MKILKEARRNGAERKKHFIRKQKRKDNLIGDISRLLESACETGDFMLTCRGEEFPCHRAILSARSPTFASGISSSMAEAGGRWTMKDDEGDEADPLAVRDVLHFIYTGDIPKEATRDRAREVLDLAMQYQLAELAEVCKEAIVEGLSTTNAVISLIQLDKYGGNYGDEIWKNKVLDFIKKNAKDVVKGEHWKMFVKNYEDLVTDIVKCLAN